MFCYILLILTIFQAFSLLLHLLRWSVISDIWCYLLFVWGHCEPRPYMTTNLINTRWVCSNCSTEPAVPHPESSSLFENLTSTQDFSSLVFGTCYQLCTFKNPIFNTHFYLVARSVAWLLYPPFDSPFSQPGCLYLPSPPFLLYPTWWISLCVLGCGEHRELITGWICLSPFDSPLLSSWPPPSPSFLFASLCNAMNISEGSRLWRACREVITG